jgi:hypothetical protein
MDRTPPEIDIVKPAEETATSGDVTVLVSMNENGRLVVTGADNAIIFDNADAEKDTQYPVDIENNGSYQVTAWDNAGNRTTSVFTVGGIDKSPPSISFNPATLNIRQGSSLRELKDLLDKGYTVFDNISKGSDLTVTYDEQSVNLAQPGVYSVIYTAVDKAGNPGTATRFVRVYSNLELEVLVNDRKTFRDETTVIDSKTVTISVNNPLGNEPYTIYISRGIKTEGQMKYNYTIISPDGNNSFTLTSNGYYTLYIVTQSRQTYITRIYIEQ